MTIDHIAIYTDYLEELRVFYETYFGGVSSDQYHNSRTGLRTYFLTFADGARLELMSRPELEQAGNASCRAGYIHMAFQVGDMAAVDALSDRLDRDGFHMISGPRTTGDGYYESCVLDPDGNQVELVARRNREQGV